jgi:hypothetical protein
MENFNYEIRDDELDAYFDNNAPAPASLDAGYIDWTTTSGFNDGVWTHTTNKTPLYAGTGLADTML